MARAGLEVRSGAREEREESFILVMSGIGLFYPDRTINWIIKIKIKKGALPPS